MANIKRLRKTDLRTTRGKFLKKTRHQLLSEINLPSIADTLLAERGADLLFHINKIDAEYAKADIPNELRLVYAQYNNAFLQIIKNLTLKKDVSKTNDGESLSVRLYSIAGAKNASGLGTTKLYALIGEGVLEARKAGRRTFVTAESLNAYLASLPPASIGRQHRKAA